MVARLIDGDDELKKNNVPNNSGFRFAAINKHNRLTSGKLLSNDRCEVGFYSSQLGLGMLTMCVCVELGVQREGSSEGARVGRAGRGDGGGGV